MVKVFCNNDQWNIYMAYCQGKSFLFRLFGGGWKDTMWDEIHKRDIQIFKIWWWDAKRLESFADEVG